MDDTTDYSLLFETPSQRRPTPKLKPNTRFLQNLVRDANSHNAALLAKETADAQARLRQLSRRGRAADAGDDDDDDRSHKRSNRHAREKSAREADDRSRRKSSRHHSSRHPHSSRRERDSRSRSPRSPAAAQGTHGTEDKKRSAGHDRRDRHERRRHSHRSRSPQDREGKRAREKRHRERSPRRERSSSDRHETADKTGSGPSETRSDSDSDPLAEFIGPRPASDTRPAAGVRIRGRGAIRGTSSMDRHFSTDYDPAADVEDAGVGASSTVEEARAEMQRDRQQLLREGAARLKAAGFTDREIAIWSRGGRRDVSDVQWTKQGEAREWDRGKVAGEDGPARPQWAR